MLFLSGATTPLSSFVCMSDAVSVHPSNAVSVRPSEQKSDENKNLVKTRVAVKNLTTTR